MVTWDFDSGDSVGDSLSQSETLYRNIANQHPSNLLALNHETECKPIQSADRIAFA